MIRPIDIRLNAAHPELPLAEAVTYTGAPSTMLIRGVPPNCGRWAITAVNVAASYPDGTTTTRAAVQSANGVWVATIPATATSGRTACGLRIMADGEDENGELVTGYVLGVADFAVASLGVTPAPEPGATNWQMLYFDTVPGVLRKGDVTKIDGVLKLYNGTEWEAFADLTNYYTAAQTDEAIDRIAAYYITYNAAGAAFPTRADLLNAQTYYSGGVARTPTRNDYAVVLADETHDGAEWRYIYAVADGQTTGQWEAQYPIETNDYTALTNKPQINGHTLTNNQTGAALGLLGNTGDQTLAGSLKVQEDPVPGFLSLLKTDGLIVSEGEEGSAQYSATKIIIRQSGTRTISLPATSGTLALLQNLAPDFSTAATYAVGQLCVYNKKLYRCTTAITTAEAWTAAHWTEATVEDVLTAIRSALDAKAPLASPAFTGTPTAPTPTEGDDSTKVATTAFVQGEGANKLDATSAAPAFSTSSTYAVDDHVTYNGKLYRCTTAVTTAGAWTGDTNWTADTMTDPDATLDVTSQNQLRVVAKDGTLLWAQGYDLASSSSATLACDAVNNFTFADGATTQAFTLPTAPTGKAGDFGLDIDNYANTGAATLTLTGLDSTFSVVVPEGESLTDMLAIAAGELARFYVTLTTFRVNNLPTWHIVKQVVENGGAQS